MGCNKRMYIIIIKWRDARIPTQLFARLLTLLYLETFEDENKQML